MKKQALFTAVLAMMFNLSLAQVPPRDVSSEFKANVAHMEKGPISQWSTGVEVDYFFNSLPQNIGLNDYLQLEYHDGNLNLTVFGKKMEELTAGPYRYKLRVYWYGIPSDSITLFIWDDLSRLTIRNQSLIYPGEFFKMEGVPGCYGFLSASRKRYMVNVNGSPEMRNYAYEVLRSWNIDTTKALVVSDWTVYSFAIGGNVNLRPGSVLMTTDGDSNIYRIGYGGLIYPTKIIDLKVVNVPGAYFAPPSYNICDGNIDSEQIDWITDPTQTFLFPQYLTGALIYEASTRTLTCYGRFFFYYNTIILRSRDTNARILRYKISGEYLEMNVPDGYDFANFSFSDNPSDWYWPGRGRSGLASRGVSWVDEGWYELTGEDASGMTEEAASVPAEFTLAQNYPNPFNPTTTIAYTLPNASQVKLSIHNMLGQEVAILADEKQGSGVHQLTWNAVGEPSGVYFAILKTTAGVRRTKMVLAK